ncbi:7513_t:CDS:1 [Ambispora leptoticha]|uniref:7513_t:CDS:1 n=1 Tax=Ambispora leptoticha TaxID=144679 RepID=A0A9N9GC80_9GLOM|nr:7513_t:CDS:1 [Ambispora leptoticha]
MTLQEKFKIWDNTPREECPFCFRMTILEQHNCSKQNGKKFDKDFLLYLHQETTCEICFKKGHPNSYCPIRTCKQCNQRGHIVKNCPNQPPRVTESLKGYWKNEEKGKDKQPLIQEGWNLICKHCFQDFHKECPYFNLLQKQKTGKCGCDLEKVQEL